MILKLLVYQRTDRHEAFPNVDQDKIKNMVARLRRKSDVNLYCSRRLFEEEKTSCKHAIFVDHGVDFDRFAAAGDDPSSEPDDVKSVARPRVGFVGSIDSHTFDPALFNKIVRLLPEMQFVMVGGCSLPDGWCTASNVYFLGQKSYEQVASYMAACDVLIMPWNNSDWIKACNPVKLKEYLATGRPVVSTPFDELKYWEGSVRVAVNAEEFAAAIQAALAEGSHAGHQEKVRKETWQAKADTVRAALSNLGISW